MPENTATIQRPGVIAGMRGAMLSSGRARRAQQMRRAQGAQQQGVGSQGFRTAQARRKLDGRVGDVRPAQSRVNTLNMQERGDIAQRALTGRPSQAGAQGQPRGADAPSSSPSPQIRPAARRQGAQEREQAQKPAQGADGAPKGGLGGVEDMAAQKFRMWLDQYMKLGLINIVAFPAWLVAVGVLNMRVLASLPTFKKTRFGKAFRFSADSIADAFNAKKGNFLALSPLTGAIAAGLVDATLALVIGIAFVILILPVYLLSLGVKALFDEGARELLTMFVKALF